MLFSLSVNGNNREVKCYLESDNWIVQNLNNALETWNSKLSEIWQLLTQNLQPLMKLLKHQKKKQALQEKCL